MPDGIYKIRNALSSDFAELAGDNPLGPICAREDGPAGANEWIIKRIDNTGSTLQNVRTGTYAYADKESGSPLHGSNTPMIWHWTSSGQIQSPSSGLVWELPSRDGCIIVVPPSAQGNTKWVFEPKVSE